MRLEIVRWLIRLMAILVVVGASTVLLVRNSPGYFAGVEDLDYRHPSVANATENRERERAGTAIRQTVATLISLSRGDLGRSRQYDVPVAELLRPRIRGTALLIGKGVLLGWALALFAACLKTIFQKTRFALELPAALLMAVPASALVSLSLFLDLGGPVLILTLMIAARDFKYLARVLQKAWFDPHILYARAQGIPPGRLLWTHVLPSLAPDLSGLAVSSIVTGLGALVPVEVLFNVSGVGQLAWSAAMNRDLPVLLSSTLVIAIAFSAAELASRFQCEWRLNEI
jgi:peptide/nickel transport system permease protein